MRAGFCFEKRPTVPMILIRTSRVVFLKSGSPLNSFGVIQRKRAISPKDGSA
jgi:hypothetical protein